jgi:hypothetical protein
MAASKRTQKKSRPANGRNKRPKPRAAALRAQGDHVRRNGAARGSQRMARTVSYAMLPASTVVATVQTMVRCSRPFAEFPLRAVQARTPLDVFRVHARFLQDVISESLLATRRFLTLTA